MKAVFIDAIVYFKFRLPPHPLSFSALSFHILNCYPQECFRPEDVFLFDGPGTGNSLAVKIRD